MKVKRQKSYYQHRTSASREHICVRNNQQIQIKPTNQNKLLLNV